ncbi:MAG TPA: metallophosphoesterase [Solirubrobacterales bacterium]|nr:metallophosphoesterase [Solirubrobacterales bacterium]
MRTAIVSDLHLGNAFGEDLLRDAEIRRALLEELDGAERLVLLGDVLELRELPLATVLKTARPFFEELGEAMANCSVVLVPGNHDHRLAEPLLEQLALAGEPLGLERRAAPSGEAIEQVAAWLGDAELEIAYPGIWLRDDVYATHGHYMDCHMRLPKLECIAAAASMRALSLPERPEPADYERVLRPVYGLTFGLAQGGGAGRAARPSERAWKAISSRNGKGNRARRAALRAAVPASVWGINRLLRADFDADFSTGSLSHSGIAAATELAQRLDIQAAHTITGHTHRAGPEEGDAEWALPGGGRLHNTGSWIFASAFHHPGTPPGPYWPGTVTWLEDSGPPQRKHLLQRPGDKLRAAVARLATAIR